MNKDFFRNPYCCGFCANDSALENRGMLEMLLHAHDEEATCTDSTDLNLLQHREKFARDLYCIFNSGRRKTISIQICRDVADHYDNIHDFANYGLSGFLRRYPLTEQQKSDVLKYSDPAEIYRYHVFDGQYLGTWKDLANFIYDKFEDEHVECAYIIYVDTSLKVIGTHKKIGYRSDVHVEPFDIERYRPYEDKVGYFLAHNHITTNARPSKDDIAMTMMFDYLMNTNETQLLDSLIAAKNRVFSIMHNKVVLIDPVLEFFNLSDAIKEHCR